MKILHIAEPFATGTLSFLIDITRSLVKQYDVYILRGERSLTPKNVEVLFDPRIHIIKVDEFKGALGSVFNPKVYFVLRKYFNLIKPDIVHMHSSASGFIGRWALPVRRLPSKETSNLHKYLWKKLASSGYKFKWTFEEAVQDWFEDNKKQYLK